MSIQRLIFSILISALLLTGCASGERVMVVQNVDPHTGKTKQTTFSNVFMGQGVIIPDTVELLMLVQLEPREYTQTYHLKKTMGALDADDLSEKGSLKALFRNLTDKPQQMQLLKANTPWKEQLTKSVDIQLEPGEISEVNLGSLITGTYNTSIAVDIEIAYQNEIGKGQMTLERKTTDEVTKMNADLSSQRAKRE